MRFSRVSTSSTASASASAPPDRPVPAPRGTNGTPVAPRLLAHRRPALSVSRDRTKQARELAQPGAGAPDRLQRLLRRRLELERRRDLEREELGIGRQLDLLVLSLGEDPERACEAPEAVPHVCGEREIGRASCRERV